MKTIVHTNLCFRTLEVYVAEEGEKSPSSHVRCEIGKHIEFDTSGLESYLFASKQAVVYDALLVAAAVEFADRLLRRSSMSWQRELSLSIPVHDPDRWQSRTVIKGLLETLNFLTGDRWNIDFYKRKTPVDLRHQEQFELPIDTAAVIPFSDGLDSKAVAGLMQLTMGNKLVRVRLGSKRYEDSSPHRRPFTIVPYKVQEHDQRFSESSARSRGFKFAIISGLAAYLAKCSNVIVPESGQGSLGPVLVPVGQGYEDFRNHPLFTVRAENFLLSLLGHRVTFQFPRIWNTKAETLRAFVNQCEDGYSWTSTRSCWQQSRQSSVDKKRRHCGVCAACVLRRFSVHAAGLSESADTYVWENLNAVTFRDGAAPSFALDKKTGSLREYAIAGVLHMDHLANLPRTRLGNRTLKMNAFALSDPLGLALKDTTQRLEDMLNHHSQEWTIFVESLDESSFIRHWTVGAR
jgi:7-cyano-7-deazaguanine synthase in queuosine biosynthesis